MMSSVPELLAVIPLHKLTGLHLAADAFAQHIESMHLGLDISETLQSYNTLLTMVFDVLQVRV